MRSHSLSLYALPGHSDRAHCSKNAPRDARLVSYAEAIFQRGLAKFPDSQSLLVAFADFLAVARFDGWSGGEAGKLAHEQLCGILLAGHNRRHALRSFFWPACQLFSDYHRLPSPCTWLLMQTFQHNALSAVNVARQAAAMTGSAFDTRFVAYALERDYESQSVSTDAVPACIPGCSLCFAVRIRAWAPASMGPLLFARSAPDLWRLLYPCTRPPAPAVVGSRPAHVAHDVADCL